MSFPQRTHTCGALRPTHVDVRVTLNGWVHVRRDLGGMIFIDLRDRYGLTQVVFVPQHRPDTHALAHELRSEDVVAVTGTVRLRPDGMTNEGMETGAIEVLADELQVLSKAEVPPFEIRDDVDASEELRLKYRYLDLRRPVLQRNLLLRHRLSQVMHRYFDARDFVEVETPVLMKSTPEGARDYLVPSRVHPGRFYALPQSPQTYKQLLQVAGLDRYVQLVKCFRDEDLRADRQPEFTQIDVEMSFITAEDIYTLIEGLVSELVEVATGTPLTLPFPRLSYNEAMRRFGSDKPDLRFGMELTDLNDLVSSSGFKVFADVTRAGGVVTGLRVSGGSTFSRKQLDDLTERARALGAGGLVWMKGSEGSLTSPIAKFLSPEILAALRDRFEATDEDLLLIVADPSARTARTVLGTLRLELGRSLGLIDPQAHALLWVTDFPMFQYDADAGRWVAEHHAFTSPKASDIDRLESDPGSVHADCYDLVWNGNEVASGSIRIHRGDLQRRVFNVMGLEPDEIQEKFGYLITAFQYGAPPHGGVALGFDRIVAILAGTPSIRDVIAFPKTNSALSLMDNSPTPVTERQLAELHIAMATPRSSTEPS